MIAQQLTIDDDDDTKFVVIFASLIKASLKVLIGINTNICFQSWRYALPTPSVS